MNTTLTQKTTRTQEIATVTTGADAAAQSGLIFMAGTSAFIGLWATACMATAMISSGPAELIRSWFSAVIG